jgi:four helix bundle protein
MGTLKSFEELECWKLAREVCKEVGELIDAGKFRKSYRLVNQVEGSSGSIMDNIAEGFERGSRAEFIQFLGYAKGSSGELRSQVYRALDRNFLTEEEFEKLKSKVITISSMIQKLIAYLQQSEIQGIRRKSEPKKP